MILDTLTTNALLIARFISAVAHCFVFIYPALPHKNASFLQGINQLMIVNNNKTSTSNQRKTNNF
jgi:hypothetical protein